MKNLLFREINKGNEERTNILDSAARRAVVKFSIDKIPKSAFLILSSNYNDKFVLYIFQKTRKKSSYIFTFKENGRFHNLVREYTTGREKTIKFPGKDHEEVLWKNITGVQESLFIENDNYFSFPYDSPYDFCEKHDKEVIDLTFGDSKVPLLISKDCTFLLNDSTDTFIY